MFHSRCDFACVLSEAKANLERDLVSRKWQKIEKTRSQRIRGIGNHSVSIYCLNGISPPRYSGKLNHSLFIGMIGKFSFNIAKAKKYGNSLVLRSLGRIKV